MVSQLIRRVLARLAAVPVEVIQDKRGLLGGGGQGSMGPAPSLGNQGR